MRLIQRYLFRQLLGHTLLATVALTGVAVLTASLSALDVLVTDRQSPVIFTEITLLATPQIVAMILPLAVCVAGLVGLNRLHTEQEIVICFAGGMSRWRVAAPAIRVAAFVALVNLVINLWVQPLCFREMRRVLEQVRADIATTMIRPGEFTHPGQNLTVFAQSMDGNGEIKNLFIDRANAHGGGSTTYMAAEARIAKRNGAPVMLLHNGSIQQFSRAGVLNVLYFDDNIQDLRPFLAIEGQVLYHPSDRYLHELFFPDLRRSWERANLKKLYSEGNNRLATPLYDLAFMALALAAVLGGAFSRLGYGTRIATAGAAGVGVRVLGFIAGAAADGNANLNFLQYSPPLICFLVCTLIVLRQHPARGPRRAPAPPGAIGRSARREPGLMGVAGRLQTYVLTRTLAGLGGALAVIASVVMLICFVELSRAYGGRSDVGFVRLVEMMLLQAPSIILLLLPFIFLFGTMAAFVTLNRRSELIAMRAAGVSAWRFIFPAAGAAFLLGVLDVMVLNPLAADLNGRYEDAKTAIEEGQVGRTAMPAVWLRQGDEHTQVVIHAQSHDMRGGVVRLQHVSLFLQNVTPNGALQFTRRIEAAEARLDPGFWRLSDVREATPGAGSVRSETLSIPSSLDRRTAMEKFAAKDAVGFWRLPDTIQRADSAGFSSAPYRLRFQELLATPLLFCGMSVLAAAFSLRLMRLGGLAGLAGAGVALGFAIFFFDRLCGALGAAEVIPAVVAGWTPPLVALLAGFTLLCYTEDG